MKALRFQRLVRVFLYAAALALPPATALAQSELYKPYDLTIVVHVADNRLLTEVFRKRIERELHDGFQAALGDMGRVRVTHEHPRLADIRARGLRALEDWKDRNDQKTHFVLIDYTGAHYAIQARQYDGTIGRPSPVIRFNRTRDRDFVAKAAALLLKHDFGILGTVVAEPENAKKQVQIELRGGGLGDMTHWVEKDDVFALAPPDGGMMEALKWALLQVEQAPAEGARDGLCLCRFFHRYRLPSIAGYRCIKLGTVQTPLRLRWVQKQKVRDGFKIKPLDQPLWVEIRRYGFDGEETTQLTKQSDVNGVLETVADGKDGLFHNVAFVRVVSGLGEGPDSHPQVPIALVDDQPVVVEVNASTRSDTLFAIRKSTWQRDVADSVQMQANLFKRLAALSADPKNRREIIAAAASGMSRAKEDRVNLLKEKEDLAQQAHKAHQDLKTPLEDRRLKQLEEYEQALAQFLAEQKKIEETENDPQRKKWLSEIENAKLLEKELEYGKAIAIYERIQKEGFQDAELDKRLEQLHKDWDARSPEHEEARGFIYRVWPTLDIARLEENIPKAQQALQTCRKVRDRIGIQKLLRGALGHADQLEKKLAELRPDLVIDDEKEALQLKKISEQISKLGMDIQDCLNALNGQ